MSVQTASTERLIYLAACRLSDAQSRQEFLDEACGSDVAMRLRLERLLKVDSDGNSDPLHQALEGFGHSSPKPVSESMFEDTPTSVHQSVPTPNIASEEVRIDISQHPVIGRYKLLEELGRGGMGAVYMAQQTSPVKRRVAVKIIKPGMDSREVIARFEAERQALALMDHPNIARVLDAGTTDLGGPYFVMELVRGIPITRFCDEKHVRLRERLELFIDLCQAVQHAHHKAIIHRDLKPGNILVTLHDGKPIVKVIDFGVAKALNQELTEQTLFTQFSQMIGTPLYMSPEQAELSGLDVDIRSDVYALGVILYELLTGTTPIARESMAKLDFNSIRKLITDQEPELPSSRISTLRARGDSTVAAQSEQRHRLMVRGFSSELDWIAMKALEKDRNRRYESANALAMDVKRFLNHEPVDAHPPSMVYRLHKFAGRYRSLVATAGFLAACLILAASLLLSEHSRTLAALAGEQTQRTKAEFLRQVAEAQEQAALNSEAKALRQRDEALHNRYVAEIVAGQSDLQRGYLQRLNHNLLGHLPLPGQPDRRGWEWFWLWSQCHPEVRTLYASTSSTFASWSPDGEFIGSSGDIWRAATGKVVKRISRSSIARGRGAWSPDGRYYAWGMASDDSGIYLCDAKTYEVRELRGHTESVWSVAWSPDGQRLASGGIDKTVRIWNVSTGETLRSLPAPDFVSSVDWSPDGELLVAGTAKQHLVVWKSVTGDVVAEPQLGMVIEGNNTQVSWDPSGEQLAVCARRTLCLLRRSDWQVTRTQKLEFQRGSDLAWSPDGEMLAVADGDAVWLWNPSKDQPEQILRGHSHPILNVSWSPGGQRLVTSDQGGELKIWDLTLLFNPPGFTAEELVQSLSWLPDNATLVVDRADGASSLWNALDGGRQKVDPAISQGELWWSPDRRLVACYETAEVEVPEIRILDAETARVHAVWQGSNGAKLLKLGWSADGTMLAIAASRPASEQPDGVGAADKQAGFNVVIWNVDREETTSQWSYDGPRMDWARLGRGTIQIAWCPDGSQVAVSGLGGPGDNGTILWQGHLYVVDAGRGVTVLKHDVGGPAHKSEVKAIAWQPDGHVVVAGTNDGLIEAVEVGSAQTVFSTRLHSTRIHALGWSPDGRRIVSAADDGSVKILSAAAGEDLLTFTLDAGAKHVAWSPAGNRLAAATVGGKVHVWDTSLADELSEHGTRRGELAMAYYRSRAKESSEDEQARLREFLRLAPDSLDFWQLRGHVRARLGEFDRAAEEYAKAITPGLNSSFSAALHYGYALLGANKTDAYRRHCRTLLDTFAEIKVASSGGHVAWLCTLLPNDDLEMETILRLAQNDTWVNADDGRDRALLNLGAAQYRSRRYEEAAQTLTEVVAMLEQSADVSTHGDLSSALYFLAMTRHQLGHAFQAQRHLDAAEKIAEVSSHRFDWITRVQLHSLDQQARALIRN